MTQETVFVYLELAKSETRHFERDRDSVLNEHAQADDCYRCEEHLLQGIEACERIANAERILLEADAEGLIDFSGDLENAIKVLYERWLAKSGAAQAWIERVEKNGYVVDNLAKFKACCESVRDWIERNEWHELARAASEEGFAEDERCKPHVEEASTD